MGINAIAAHMNVKPFSVHLICSSNVQHHLIGHGVLCVFNNHVYGYAFLFWRNQEERTKMAISFNDR